MNVEKRPLTWVWWTSGEGLTRTATKILMRILGVAQASMMSFVLVTAIIGFVMMVAGYLGGVVRRKAFFEDRIQVIGAIGFGVLAYFVTVVSLVVFQLDGDVGVNTFISTLAIIPGGIFGSMFFGDRLFLRQWGAIALAIIAGYVVIGRPSLQEAMQLPAWIWLSFAAMFGMAFNQVISQRIKEIDPMVKNFWSGGTQMVLSLLTICIAGSVSVFTNISEPTLFWTISISIGFINVALLAFNILSYKLGANIPLKNLVTNGVHLSTAMILGIFMFDEGANWEKFAGVVLYLAAFAAWDNETWKFLRLKFRVRHS